ncbi:MAG TPA: PhnD/SsuA/transferrin family substrate-binding protein [Dokdonella sp.]
MRRSLVRLVLRPFLLAAAATLQACAGDTAPAAVAAHTKLVYGEQRNLQIVAEAAHAFDGAPYALEWATFATPSVEFEAFRAGSLDLASSNDITILNAAATGVGLKIVAALRGDALQKGVGIIVQRDSSIRSVADLKGRRVVVSSARGGSGDNLLHGALKEAGLAPGDVDISYAPFPDALSAFRSDALEALVTNDPFLILAERHGGRVLRNGEGINSGLGFVVASDAALADPARRGAIADALARLGAASRWCRAHPDDYARAYAERNGIDAELARLVVDRTGTTVVPISAEIVATAQKVADDLAERGFWPRRVDVHAYFDAGVFVTPAAPLARND